MNKINITIADCENLIEAWKQKDKEYVKEEVIKMNSLEALKFARQIMLYHSDDGGLINQIINYIIEEKNV